MSCAVDNSSGVAKTISNDIMELSWELPREEWVYTGLDKSAEERTLLRADAKVSATGAFNDATDMSHDVFKTVPSTTVARTVTIAISGQTLAGELLPLKYDMERSDSGELTWEVELALADGTAMAWS